MLPWARVLPGKQDKGQVTRAMEDIGKMRLSEFAF